MSTNYATSLKKSHGYNSRGEVTSAVLKNSSNIALPGWNHVYGYDQIGTRTSQSGDAGAKSYTPNSTNQYSSVNDGTQYVVRGRAPTPSNPSVAVDSVSQAIAKQNAGMYDYFKSSVTVNGANPEWDLISVGSGGDNGSWFKASPPASHTPSFDQDGNLASDWRWTYTWDAENRLTKMVTTTAAVNAGIPNWTLEFVYDYLGRRVRKTSKLSGTTAVDTKFVYDRWNLVGELNALTSDSLVRSYIWGLDKSDTFQGAGGVGGLLVVRQFGASPTDHLVCYDGNGNVTAMVDASTSAETARFSYDPFGQKCRAYGSMSGNMRFGYSTKYEDTESGYLYYGYRYYSPEQGRWLSRDPIGESGGTNLYGFVGNDGVNRWDYLGLDEGDAFHIEIPPDVFEQGRDFLPEGAHRPLDVYFRHIQPSDPGFYKARQLMWWYAVGQGRPFNADWTDFMLEREELQDYFRNYFLWLGKRLIDTSSQGESGRMNVTYGHDATKQFVSPNYGSATGGLGLFKLPSMQFTLHNVGRLKVQGDWKVVTKAGSNCGVVHLDNFVATWLDRGDLHGGTTTPTANGQDIDDQEFLDLGFGRPYDIAISFKIPNTEILYGSQFRRKNAHSGWFSKGWPGNPSGTGTTPLGDSR